MLDKFKLLIEKFNNLTLRERVLVLIAFLVVMQQAWDSLVWIPLDKQQHALLARETAINKEMLQLQVDLKILTAKATQDPDRETKAQIAKLEAQLAAINQQIESTSASLVSPAEMARLLEQLLTSEAGLKLKTLTTLNSEPLISSEDQAKTQGSYQIYRHGFSIEFEGSYMATLRYIEALEKLPWTFFWDGVEYRVERYPDSTVRLNLYTLSLSEGWIGV